MIIEIIITTLIQRRHYISYPSALYIEIITPALLMSNPFLRAAKHISALPLGYGDASGDVHPSGQERLDSLASQRGLNVQPSAQIFSPKRCTRSHPVSIVICNLSFIYQKYFMKKEILHYNEVRPIYCDKIFFFLSHQHKFDAWIIIQNNISI